jgi:NAD(P)-dependent dehydrogenase (short-subunit alcohol dehydrogenase family)
VFGDPDDPAALERRRYRETLAPLRRVGTPADIADPVVFLAGRAASHITGAELVVDGGASLTTMPGSHVLT